MNLKSLVAALVSLGVLTGCATLAPQDRAALEQSHIPAPLYQKMLRYQPLSLPEIVELSRRKVDPALIVRYVDHSLAEYQLTTDEVLHLRQAGVPHQVINYLLRTPSLRPRYQDVGDPYWGPAYPPVITYHHHHHHKRR